MVPRQLNQHPDFREVKVPHASLKDLPAGSIVVWNRSLENPQGDITVALGDGQRPAGQFNPSAWDAIPSWGFEPLSLPKLSRLYGEPPSGLCTSQASC